MRVNRYVIVQGGEGTRIKHPEQNQNETERRWKPRVLGTGVCHLEKGSRDVYKQYTGTGHRRAVVLRLLTLGKNTDTMVSKPLGPTRIFPCRPTLSDISHLRDCPFMIWGLCCQKIRRVNSNHAVILPHKQVLLMKNTNEITALENKTNSHSCMFY